MMPALPPLQVSASSSAKSDALGGTIGAAAGMQSGDWNISFGSGSISTSKGVNVLVLAGVALGGLWLMRKR